MSRTFLRTLREILMPDRPAFSHRRTRSPRSRGRRYVCAAAVIFAVVSFAVPCHAARILTFNVSTGTIAGVATAEINADGMVVMRLRSTDGTRLRQKAVAVASRLTDLALEGLRPEQIAVERVQGEWSVTGASRLIVTADAETARVSGLDARSLCESWGQRIAEVLRRPYLCIAPHDIIVVPHGERRTVRFGGTIAAPVAVSSANTEMATVGVEGPAGNAVLHGVGTGTTALSFEVGDLRHAITVEVRRWAARIAGESILRVMGSGPLGQMAEAAIVNAALSAVRFEPGAVVRVVGRQQSPAGHRFSISAAGLEYLPVSEDVLVRVVGGLPPLPPSESLLISNYPERVTGLGMLMRQDLRTGRPARMMWHHKNFTNGNVAVAVRLVNAGSQPAKARISWAEAGPDRDEIFVGFNAMRRYWDVVRTGVGFEAHVPAGKAFEATSITIRPQDVVSGLMELVVEEGADTYLEVMARDPNDAPTGFLPLPRTGGRLPVTPYEFPGYFDGEVNYVVGGRHEHYCVGRDHPTNEQGMTLMGSFGINHRVRITATNPTERPARKEIALRAGGGVARFIVSIDGSLVQTHLLQAGQEQVLAQRDLAPGATTAASIEVIPTAGSNLPLTLITRAR